MVRRTSTENFERIDHLQDRITHCPGRPAGPGCLIHILQRASARTRSTTWPRRASCPPVAAAGADRRVHGPGRHAHAGGDPPGRSRHPLLPGQQQRDVRQGARGAAERDDAVSTRAAPTAWPRSTATGSRSTIARATTSSPARASSSTTSRRAAGWSSSPARSRTPSRASSSALHEELQLGNLDAARLGLRGDYVRAMWLMLQQDQPDDYVVATGETHSVREVLRGGLRPRRPRLATVRRESIRLYRPAEVDLLVGDRSKAGRARLGQQPTVTFPELVRIMVDADLGDSAAVGESHATRADTLGQERMSCSDIKFGTDGWRGSIAEDYTFDNVRRWRRGLRLSGSQVNPGEIRAAR